METLYALFLVVAPILSDGTIGQDEWTALDGNLSFYDCAMEAFDRSDAATKLFGPGTVASMACEIDAAPEAWKEGM